VDFQEKETSNIVYNVGFHPNYMSLLLNRESRISSQQIQGPYQVHVTSPILKPFYLHIDFVGI